MNYGTSYAMQVTKQDLEKAYEKAMQAQGRYPRGSKVRTEEMSRYLWMKKHYDRMHRGIRPGPRRPPTSRDIELETAMRQPGNGGGGIVLIGAFVIGTIGYILGKRR